MDLTCACFWFTFSFVSSCLIHLTKMNCSCMCYYFHQFRYHSTARGTEFSLCPPPLGSVFTLAGCFPLFFFQMWLFSAVEER